MSVVEEMHNQIYVLAFMLDKLSIRIWYVMTDSSDFDSIPLILCKYMEPILMQAYLKYHSTSVLRSDIVAQVMLHLL